MTKNRLSFLLDFGKQMVKQYATERKVYGRRPKIPGPSRKLERHFEDLIPSTAKKAPTNCYSGVQIVILDFARHHAS